MLNWKNKTTFGSVLSFVDFDVYKVQKKEVIFEKPIYLGFTISEFSKLIFV